MPTDNIQSKEHGKLIKLIGELFSLAEAIPTSLDTGDTSYLEHGDILNWLNHYFIALDDSFNLLNERNSYKAVFSTLRSVFEAYWIIHLAMNGTKYYRYSKVKKGHDKNKIYKKWKKDLTDCHKKGQKKDILGVEIAGKYLRVSYKGMFDQTHEHIIPLYYDLFHQYDPLIAYLGKEPRLIENYLIPPFLVRRHHVNHKETNENYFVFSKGVQDHLRLNKFVNNKKWQKINVHYNFLSMWTHPNIKTVRMVDGNVIDSHKSYKYINEKYNFYLTRLALLYIGNLLVLFFKSFLDYTKRQKKEGIIKKVKNVDVITNKIDEFYSATDYFWFTDNKPHHFYKWNYCINRLWSVLGRRRRMKLIKPSDLSNNRVLYYQNPFEILQKMDMSQSNQIMGIHTSPLKRE